MARPVPGSAPPLASRPSWHTAEWRSPLRTEGTDTHSQVPHSACAVSPCVPGFFHLCRRFVVVAAATHRHIHRVTEDTAAVPRLSPSLVQPSDRSHRAGGGGRCGGLGVGVGVEAKLGVSAVPGVHIEALRTFNVGRGAGLGSCSALVSKASLALQNRVVPQTHEPGNQKHLRFPPNSTDCWAAESTGRRHVLVEPPRGAG